MRNGQDLLWIGHFGQDCIGTGVEADEGWPFDKLRMTGLRGSLARRGCRASGQRKREQTAPAPYHLLRTPTKAERP